MVVEMIRFERSIRGQLKISSTPAIDYRMNRSPLILNDRFVRILLNSTFHFALPIVRDEDELTLPKITKIESISNG